MPAPAKSVTPTLHHIHFPNETPAYRAARNALLADEIENRRLLERAAAKRRKLPPGGAIPEDYVFEATGDDSKPRRLRLSQLFAPGQDSLAIYSFMFGPECEEPCTGCVHFLDGHGATLHIRERLSFVVVAKSPLPRLLDLAKGRGWRYLRLLSTAGNDYSQDYFGDSALSPAVRRQQDLKDGEEWDMPMLNVFRRDGDTIRHFWGQELLYVPPEPGQEYRHDDLLDPVWNMLDVTGRGDFDPKLRY